MTEAHPGFLSDETFEIIRENSVIPTFDLIIEVPEEGVLIARRSIAPYKDVWALPGLRMFKGEDITDTLTRIAANEAGVEIDLSKARLIGQYVGKFTTENNRQDLSSCYVAPMKTGQELQINKKHFTGHRLITDASQVPDRTGAMYKRFLGTYFTQ